MSSPPQPTATAIDRGEAASAPLISAARRLAAADVARRAAINALIGATPRREQLTDAARISGDDPPAAALLLAAAAMWTGRAHRDARPHVADPGGRP